MSGKLIIFSAPSGSGKTTIVKELVKQIPQLDFSISATTRGPRGVEEHGKDYYFFTKEDFEEKIKKQEFAEYEEVYPGRYYGTLRNEVERIWERGIDVLFDVDVKGGVNLKKVYGNRALALYIKVPSIEVLEQRLRSRGTEDEENIRMRMSRVEEEMRFEKDFDVVVLNETLEKAVEVAVAEVQKFLD